MSAGVQALANAERFGGGDDQDLCLLSLDGGGVRGLSSLYILSNIMTRVNAEREQHNEKPVKPCQIFDMIGGTSTGGLIAILLGRLELDVDECIALYRKLIGSVFGKKQHVIPAKLTTGEIQNQFDQQRLKDAILSVLKDKNIPADEMYDNGVERTCRTFVVARRVESTNPVAIRDYTPTGEQNHDKATIVEAALATSAASSFFPSVKIGSREYVDGALGTNNPIVSLWKEAQDVWDPENGQIQPRIKAIISIGTGHPGMKKIEKSVWGFFKKTLTSLVVQTEQTARDFEFVHRDMFKQNEQRHYYRFNVDHGLEDVGLEEFDKVHIIETATIEYLTLNQDRKALVTNCGRWLSGKEFRTQRMKANLPRGANLSRHTLLECNECISSLLGHGQTARKNKFNASFDSSASWYRKRVSNIKEAEKGTLEWLGREGTDLHKWISLDRGLFWIRGKPGSGKSVTMKHLYTEYKNKAPANEIVVGHFFTKLGEPIENSVEGLLRVLLARMLRQNPLLFRSIREYYRSMMDLIIDPAVAGATPVEWTESDLRTALIFIFETVQSDNKVTLFVDAVDECEPEEEDELKRTIRMLSDFCAHNFPLAVKVCFSTRTNPKAIDDTLTKIPGFILEDHTEEDIASYLPLKSWEATVAFLPGQDRSELRKTFLKKANGCWLWVEYAVKVLSKKGNTLADFKRELDKIPPKLNELFDTFLEAIHPDYVEETNRMLAIASASQGYLDVEDFRYVMGLGTEKKFKSYKELKEQENFIQDDFTMWSRIQDRCGNLLEVKMQNSSDDVSRGHVEFYHSSVKEYLSERAVSTDSKILSYQQLLKKGNEELARACQRYLGFPDVVNLIQELELSGGSFLAPLTVVKKHPFIFYCAYFAFQHSCHVVEQDGDMAIEVEKFWTSAQFDSWLAIRKWLRLEDQLGDDTTLTAFSIAEGATAFVKRQIENKLVDINETLPNFGHYLTLAAYAGEKDIVEMLLDLEDSPVDIDAKGGVYCTALQAAACEGNVEIMRILLDRGADPRINGGKYISPLCAAAFSLNAEAVELLATHPRSSGTLFNNLWHSRKALEFAGEAVRVKWGESDGTSDPFLVIRLLAGHSFEYTLFEYVGIPIALWLLLYGSVDAMEILSRDARFIDNPFGDGYTLLHIACAEGTREKVKKLVETHIKKHMPLDRTDIFYCTPLHFAAMNSKTHEVLEYLLEQNYQTLDVDAQDARAVTPLHVAFAVGSKQHIDLLIQAKANTKVVGADKMTMLHFAMLNQGDSDRLDALEKVEAVDINAIDSWDRTPLHIAAQYGTIENVRWLLNRSADIKLVDDEGRTALHAACQNFSDHSAAIIDILIEKGLSLSAEDFGKRTPLHLAFYDPKQAAKGLCWVSFRDSVFDAYDAGRCYQTVKHILEKDGLDLNCKDSAGTTPLHLACWREMIKIIYDMTDMGAKVDAKDKIGSKPFDLVGNEEVRDGLKEMYASRKQIT